MVWWVGSPESEKNLELSTVGNGDRLAGLDIPGPKTLHGFHNVHAFFHLPKDYMFAIHPLSLGSADKKLGTICVWSSICHGQDARTWMLQDEVLILKLLSVGASAARAIMVSALAIVFVLLPSSLVSRMLHGIPFGRLSYDIRFSVNYYMMRSSVQGDKCGTIYTLLHTDIQFDQHQFLKDVVLFFPSVYLWLLYKKS
ncbi:hypothetical protein STEG23_003037, partial [Scotinomys teguina]